MGAPGWPLMGCVGGAVMGLPCVGPGLCPPAVPSAAPGAGLSALTFPAETQKLRESKPLAQDPQPVHGGVAPGPQAPASSLALRSRCCLVITQTTHKLIYLCTLSGRNMRGTVIL